jgi:hypothetical protein
LIKKETNINQIMNPIKMKYQISYFTTIFLLLISSNIQSQIGLGTTSPDASALLDLSSTTKGLLPPRMTQIERDGILLPANGLMVYNTTTNTVNINSGTPVLKVWEGIASAGTGSSAASFSVNESAVISTMSKTDEVVSGMSIIPGAGTYSVAFNAQYYSAPFNYDVNLAQQGLVDLQATYDKLMAMPVTNDHHAPAFGSGEIITAGVYTVADNGSVAGTLVLDAQGNPNAIFVFRFGLAFLSDAGTTVILANAASACNVFWVAENALSLGASTKMKGTLISHGGAVSIAALGELEGRMFSSQGAITLGPGKVTTSLNCELVDIGILSSFALFTSVGAVTNTSNSEVTGNIGSNQGSISGFDGSTIIGGIYGPESPLVNIDKNVVSTFSIYQNGVAIPNSNRIRRSKTPTTDVSLQAIATVVDGQAIDVRWNTDVSQLKINNRILTLIKIK